jgi:5-methylcytosine-specific restriction endonuclease McrA
MTNKRCARLRAEIDAAASPGEQLTATVAYLRAVAATHDPALADIVFDKAAQNLLGLAELVAASAAVGRNEVLGMRHLPAHLEDPRRPGWLDADELKRRRRQWAKCKTRRVLYEQIAQGSYECALCSGESVFVGGDAYLVIDHIIPLARGGTNDDLNLQVLCETCNTRKGALL